MTPVIQPFHILVLALTGCLNRQQQAVIDYLIEESRVLKHQLEGQWIQFTDGDFLENALVGDGYHGYLYG